MLFLKGKYLYYETLILGSLIAKLHLNLDLIDIFTINIPWYLPFSNYTQINFCIQTMTYKVQNTFYETCLGIGKTYFQNSLSTV